MNTMSYGDFSRALRTNAGRNRLPLNGSIEVTHRCPLACAHCYNNRPMSDGEARGRELSAAELRRILGEIAGAGGLYLLFTGGEVFARKDFLEIYRHAKELGFIITLFTNGMLITDAVADVLAHHRPFAVEITLYGSTPESYERLTGVRGAFQRVRAGIRRLVDRGIPLRLKSVGVTHTASEIADMNAFALAEVGAPLKFDSLINGRIDGGRAPLETRLAPERVVELDLRDAARVGAWRDFAAAFGGPVQPAGDEGRRYHCGGGVTSYAIDPEGKLSICVLSRREQFDLRQGSFQDGWSRFLRGVRAQNAARATKCTGCGIKAMCGMCPAMGELESGDPDEPVGFLCEVAHLRAAVLGLPVAHHGACELCPGGARHRWLLDAAERIQRGEVERAARRSLPVLTASGGMSTAASEASGCGAGACGSCA